MEGRKAKISIYDAVEALATGGKGKLDRKTLKKIRAALRTGDWKLCPRHEMGL